MGLPTTIQQSGKTATGIQVPDQIVQALGSGRRPAEHRAGAAVSIRRVATAG